MGQYDRRLPLHGTLAMNQPLAQVRIVGITQPIQSIGLSSPDNLLVYMARVSNPTSQRQNAPADKLIRYLIRRKEWSPFEMINVAMEITTTRDIGRQILRHKSAAFQEFSQRYALADNFVLREARMRHQTNRQSSIPCTDKATRASWAKAQREVWDGAKKAYRWAIKAGIAPEVARVVLPEGMTVTRLFMSAPLRTWIHYIALRTDDYVDPTTGETVIPTQYEHRLIAEAARAEIFRAFPSIAAALEEK